MLKTFKKNNYILYLLTMHIVIGFVVWLGIFELLKLG